MKEPVFGRMRCSSCGHSYSAAYQSGGYPGGTEAPGRALGCGGCGLVFAALFALGGLASPALFWVAALAVVGVVVAFLGARDAKVQCERQGGEICPQCKTRNAIKYTSF